MTQENVSKLSILGTEYTIKLKSYAEDADFKRMECNGYCCSVRKEIVLCDMSTYPGWEQEPKEVIHEQMKRTLRHEIVHAYLNESGLACNSSSTDAWARNEEIVDWFALQGLKIHKTWKEAGAV